MGFLKLVAGMLGVGLDDLVQRETTHRHRRLAWLTAASLAGMAVTSTLAITAIQARDAARDQRREAEGLVAFMLGDLKDKLEPIGRLDALDGVGSRVLAYYSKQNASDLTDAALVQRSRALSLTAQVAYLRGNLDEAQGLYRQALAGTAEAVNRSPDDPKRLYEHAQNVFWLGELARFRGQTREAVSAYREYKQLADRLVAIEPDNLKWRWEGLFGVENIGIVLYNERRFAEATRQFESVVGPMQSLASVDAGNLTYQKELSTALAWSADAQRAQGNLDAAISFRERQVALLDRAVAKGATDVDLRQQLIPARQGLGILLASHGQAERSIEQLRSAVGEADRLIPVEPENALWRILAASARLELARTLLSLARAGEAAQQAESACSVIVQLRSRDPANPRLRALQTRCLVMRARLALQSGASANALAFGQQAVASAESVHSGDPIRDRYNVAAAYRLVGDIRARMGDSDGAKEAWSDALGSLPGNIAEMPAEMDERALILERLGHTSEARQIAARLTARGVPAPGLKRAG
jgi:tetratricopeptide (TPR) repeat protein